MADITVVGSINMDLVASTHTLPQPGETVLGHQFDTVPGGKGSNQAIAASRAGAAVRFVGAVGSDSFAATLIETLQSAGVDCRLVRTAPGASGIAAISVDDDAENSIIVIPGANSTLTSLTNDDTRAITSSAALVTQLEIPMSTVVAAAEAASAADVPVLLNPSPVQKLPKALLAAVSVLIVNEGEAAALGDEVIAAAPHLVTTLGPRGAHYRGPDGAAVTVAAPQVDPVDTTGAGDAFTGALAAAWAAGSSTLDALQRACAAGALATTTSGASASSPTATDIDALVSTTYQSGS